jgi:hypothetical protein
MARERQGIGYHSLGANFKKITIEISRFEVCKKCFHLVCWWFLENWREKTMEIGSEERQLLKLGARKRQQLPQLGATMH